MVSIQEVVEQPPVAFATEPGSLDVKEPEGDDCGVAVGSAGMSNFRLPVASALPDAAFELSAPLPWKRVLRLAVFGRF